MRTARGAAGLLYSSQLLAGVAGVGKSHLLATLAREAALAVIHVSSAGITPPRRPPA
jgi:putative ribosome biogenesis GTPase RsgA